MKFGGGRRHNNNNNNNMTLAFPAITAPMIITISCFFLKTVASFQTFQGAQVLQRQRNTIISRSPLFASGTNGSSSSHESSSASSFPPASVIDEDDLNGETSSSKTKINGSSSSNGNSDKDAVEDESLPLDFLTLPRHSNPDVNKLLLNTEVVLSSLHKHSKKVASTVPMNAISKQRNDKDKVETIYANSYVDLGKVDVVGFDYDYTLVTYTEELLELIYDMALNRLVSEKRYPVEMLEAGLQFDPHFSIRGLAVDKENGWICHLSYTHKVAVAWEGRERVETSRIYSEYRGKRILRPNDRRKRLKPLNDLFSMAECCLIADTIQFFKDNDIPYCARNAINDILSAIRETHISGDFHRIVAENPEKYFDPVPNLEEVLTNLKQSGKRLIFASNSPFWYVDAGMKYILGQDWRDMWDAVITSAGKPNFYTDNSRPFREVCLDTGRLKFNKVEKFKPGEVYTEGCLRELTRLMDWNDSNDNINDDNNGNDDNKKTDEMLPPINSGAVKLTTSNVLYIGDSLFADLVDAKREYGWTTAAVTPEVGYEIDMLKQPDYVLTRHTINLLLNTLRLIQDELGASIRTNEDIQTLDALEKLVSTWRDRETFLLGNPFGSVFSARYQPSLFAHSLRRYCDLYMSNVGSLRFYSPQHRFYPEQDARLLAHEISEADPVCWDLEDVIEMEENCGGIVGAAAAASSSSNIFASNNNLILELDEDDDDDDDDDDDSS